MDIKNLSDEELAFLAQEKNADAFSEIIERYKNLIKVIIRPYYLVGGDTEDLMQEGMIAVFKAVESFSGKTGFKGYAYRCIKNAVISVIRRYNTDNNKAIANFIPLTGLTGGDEDKNLMLIDVAESPETAFINKEAENEFMLKLKKVLSQLEYDIVSLYLQGYSYREISNQTKKSEKSIDNALQRIKKKALELYVKV